MSDAAPPSDEDLVRRVRAGDETAARLLFDRHLPALRAKARARLPAAIRAKIAESDVIQEAYLAAFVALPEFEDRGDGAFGKWLRGILAHKVDDEVRRLVEADKRDVRREIRLPTTAAGVGAAAPESSPSGVFVAAEDAAALHAALSALPEDHRVVVRLVHDEGLTLVEAARRMGRSPDAVRKLYGRVVSRLGRVLGDGGAGGR